MDTDFSTTQARYIDFLTNTPMLIANSVAAVTDEARDNFRKHCTTAKRIFFTAAGSSIPAALYGMYALQQEGHAASFLPTGSILGLKSLSSSDVVILCSQGMNRADAALAVSAVKSRNAKLIIFTANRDTPLTTDADLVIYFDPETEKLFCRPAGVATNLAVVASVLGPTITSDSLVDAWKQGEQHTITIKKEMRYITLASDIILPANWNMALALREGCGVLAQNFDIETYAHGNYVGDLAHEPYEYITLSADESTEAARSVRRFMPFITASQVKNTEIQAPFTDAARANLYVLGLIARSTYDANMASHYNMNTPKGKEENRYYHERASYEL
jgi:fructoselysine-6-P-deglycase FrlB-like protein